MAELTITNPVAKTILSEHMEIVSEKIKGVTFRANNSKEIVLTWNKNNKAQLNRPHIYIWAEAIPDSFNEYVTSVQKKKTYEDFEPRSSYVNNNSNKLGLGNKAYYLKIYARDGLEKFVNWYINQ